MFLTGAANFDGYLGDSELKTWYSKQLLDRLVPALRHRMRFSWMHRFMTEKRIFNGKQWVAIVGPCDEMPNKPRDVRPRLPQSIQYPPGMEPKPMVWNTTLIIHSTSDTAHNLIIRG